LKSLTEKWDHYFSSQETPLPFVIQLIIPVVIDQFFAVAFNVINTGMISSSGKEAVSAVSMVGSINFLLMQLFFSVGIGGTVLIAQTLGEKAYKKVGRLALATVLGTFLVAAVISIVGLLFKNQILTTFFGGAEAKVLENASIYFGGLLMIYPIQAIVDGTNGTLRGIGQTKESLKNSLFMNFIYIVMNIVFVSYLKLGVQGLVYSLLISRSLGAILAIILLKLNADALYMRFREILTIKWSEIKRILVVAMPFAAETAAFNGGKILVQMIVVSFGTNVMTAFAIAVSWSQLAEIVPSALGTSLVPIIGRNIGAERHDDAKRLTKSFVYLAIGMLILVDLLLILTFKPGMTLFHPEASIFSLIFQIYLIFAIFHAIAWSFSFVLPQALRAGGDAKYTTVVSMVSMWVYRVGFGYLVGIGLGWGILGIAAVMGTEWLIRGGIFMKRFKSGKWIHKLAL
jgi:putative MATE family efflux protein